MQLNCSKLLSELPQRLCSGFVLRVWLWVLVVVKPLGRPRRRWVDNIRMDLQEVGCGYMDWIGLAQDRQVADPCEYGNEPSGSVKCGELID